MLEKKLKEVNDEKNFTDVMFYSDEGRGKDRDDKPSYKVKVDLAFSFNNEVNLTEYYHNSSFLEHGGSPDKAVKNAFIYDSFEAFKTSKMNPILNATILIKGSRGMALERILDLF